MTTTLALDPSSPSRFLIYTGPRNSDLMRLIPGATHDRKRGCWKAPLTWNTALAMRSTFGEDLTFGEDINAWAHKQVAREQYAEGIKAGTWHETLAQQPWAEGLYDFQVAGGVLLSEMEQVLMADEMGTGKTVQSATALRRLSELGHGAFPALVVCTNSMKGKWAEEIEKWVPGTKAYVVQGSKAKRLKIIEEAREAFDRTVQPVVLIINWEGVKGHSRLAGYGSVALKKCIECEPRAGDPSLKETACQAHPREFNGGWIRTVIADEAHKAKDPKAQQTRALWAVGHAARYRFALTGTPVAGEPTDLWSIMHFLAPEEHPSKSRFIDRYTISTTAFAGRGLDVLGFNPATKPELDRLIAPRFIARPKSEVLKSLPPVTYSTRWVDMAPGQKKAYDQMAEHMLAVVESEIIVAPDPLTRMTRLLQFAAATPVLETDEEGRAQVTALTAPSCKTAALLDIIEEAGEKSLVVFAESRKLLELCAEVLDKHKISHVSVTGAVSTEQRKINVDTFQHGDAQVILVSLGAGAEGITLTAADTAVFLQRSFKMTANRQAEARIHRIGQESANVEIIDVIARGTIEVAVHETALDKEEILNQVLRDPAWIRRAIQGEHA